MADTGRIMTIYEKADDLYSRAIRFATHSQCLPLVSRGTWQMLVFVSIIYNHGLLKILQKYGDVYIVGSYKMGIMTWNDLDFYMDKSSLNEQNYYSLTSDIVKEMMPGLFNGEINIKKELAFLGFETKISDDRWNIDIWWKDKAEIDDSIAYANDIVQLMHKRPELKDAVMKIKQDLITRGLYGFDKGKKHYHSKEIYDAVLNEEILTTERFLIVHNLF